MNDRLLIHGRPFKPYISEEEIRQRVTAIGADLKKRYEGKRPLMIGILNGAFVFISDLCRACDFECEISFTRLSSYVGLESSGEIKTLIGLQKEDIKGRDIIIVEDIVDTGQTLHQFFQTLDQMEPASVCLVALLVKPEAIQYPFPIDYCAFEIPNKFVVGYGLDYDGLARNLASIYQLDE